MRLLENQSVTYFMGQFVLVLLVVFSSNLAAQSTCFGSTSAGRLENACKLPFSGDNFTSYSRALSLAGRTYVHCDVKRVLVDAYDSLASDEASWVFVYGETGKKKGGEFKPHKTHQNGLSVDFMVPVHNENGKSVALPTNVLNKYGYNIDFTLDGKYKNLSIDYEAMAAHIAAIKRAAESSGVGIWRVIFDPKMQGALKKTKSWSEIADLQFSERRSWVRHDDHYHIDFQIPCKDL